MQKKKNHLKNYLHLMEQVTQLYVLTIKWRFQNIKLLKIKIFINAVYTA